MLSTTYLKGLVFMDFRMIATCKHSREACNNLSIMHEGTLVAKFSNLQMLTTKFESIKMKEDEAFTVFFIQN